MVMNKVLNTSFKAVKAQVFTLVGLIFYINKIISKPKYYIETYNSIM